MVQSSIIRPAANEFIREYVRRVRGGAYEPLHPLLAEILEETHGILCYQEDVSRVAMALAGFDAVQADQLRKILSKKHKQARLKHIKAAKAALEQREETLNPGQVIDPKKQISFADKEARIMGKKCDFDYRYTAQISVDADLQIIVAQHLSQNANDKQEVEPALAAVKAATGTLPEKLTADNGYMSVVYPAEAWYRQASAFLFPVLTNLLGGQMFRYSW